MKAKSFDLPNLNERERVVFRAIMENYIFDAEPVGSRKIAKLFDLSPATIRNIMADLEDYGLLEQPHISSGRIPSDEGYRFYVDNLIGISDPKTIAIEHRREIHETLDVRAEIEKIMLQVSSLLSKLTNYAGLVVAPKIINMTFQRIQFIRLGECRILSIFVTTSGLLNNKIVITDQDYQQETLDRITRLLNERFENKTLCEIRSELVQMLEEDQRNYDILLDSATHLVQQALNKDALDKEKLYLDGTVRIFDLPDFNNLGKLRELFKAFTENSAIVRLLDRCLATEGVSVAIGSETDIPEIRDMSVVTAKYNMSETLAGGLGVIGPKRMPYQQVITLVSYMASVLSLMLQSLDSPKNSNRDFDKEVI